MTHPITLYLNEIEANLATGKATEHSHRPALASLFETLQEDIKAINEPTRAACGAPDLAIIRQDFMVGHVEAKDVGVPLDKIEKSDQLTRYRLALDNLILTDYLEFRWYVNGELRRSVLLAKQDIHGSLQVERNGRDNLSGLLSDFFAHEPQQIGTARELAERMARLTHLIRDVIVAAFNNGQASELLKGWRRAFAQVLIPDLDQPENLGQFADMFAQTLSYGLFSARIMHKSGVFHRYTAQESIPRTNPFLRNFFSFITGPQLSDEPYGGLVDDLIQLLALADMHAILADFGRGTRQDDPMMHFYETFLSAYDPQLRERRGVYYTPMPVVSFIVRSVDELLKTRFTLPRGLADTSRLPDGTHKVLVLDPAVGTATFLYAVIDLIRDEFMQRDDAGMWSGYVRDHLLDRIFGFEIMMAPYAVAHFKLALQLAGHDLDLPEEQRVRWAYDFQADDRIQVYLTNTLEILPENMPGLYGPMQFVSTEAKAADAVKQEKPIMVVLGNPPYSVSSANKSEFIESLMDSYKEAVRDERNIQPLSDDYIKFIRFAHDRIERTGSGVVAMITNHIYLNGLIHRGMREELLNTFDEIFIVNLHGNSIVRETTPEGGLDENVFDIRQGVAISFFIKKQEHTDNKAIFYKDFWGRRQEKYSSLFNNIISSLEWNEILPIPPNYFFVPKEFDYFEEYQNYFQIEECFKEMTSGVKTHRDHFVVDFTEQALISKINFLSDINYSNEKVNEKFDLQDTSSWSLKDARNRFLKNQNRNSQINMYVYRPYDLRMILYSKDFIERPRHEIMQNLLEDNIGLVLGRAGHVINSDFWNLIYCTNKLTDTNIFRRGGGIVFPIFLYPEKETSKLFDITSTSEWGPDVNHGNRVPNLKPMFVNMMENELGLIFDPQFTKSKNDSEDKFGPEDILAYIYAIFHSPTYRERYAEFLKIDFPRVPLTSDADLFRKLVNLGRELISLHLMESPQLQARMTHYPIVGDNQVAPRGGYPKYSLPEDDQAGRVFINREQYFEGVPAEVWNFEIGGYQVLHKWLKDRRGRTLDYDDIEHYQKIVVALSETIRLMNEIDAAIPGWPLK